jgi:hypothetical protein
MDIESLKKHLYQLWLIRLFSHPALCLSGRLMRMAGWLAKK